VGPHDIRSLDKLGMTKSWRDEQERMLGMKRQEAEMKRQKGWHEKADTQE
jgi:hypothetical protein